MHVNKAAAELAVHVTKIKAANLAASAIVVEAGTPSGRIPLVDCQGQFRDIALNERF